MLSANRDQWPEHIQERYPKPGRPWFLYLIALLFTVFIGAFILIGVERVINPPLSQKLLAYGVVNKNNVEITFEIRRPVEMNVWCLLRAKDFYMSDIGYAIIEIPKNGQEYQEIKYVLKTTEEAYSAEIVACDDQADSRLFVYSQFAPGVIAPVQDPPAISSGL